MADSSSFKARDYWGEDGWYSFWWPPSTASSIISDFRDLVAITTSALPYYVNNTTDVFGPVAPSGGDTTTGRIWQAVKLTFTTAAGYHSVWILGPDPAWFLPDGSVDDTYAPGQDVIAYILANQTSEDDEPLLTYSDGLLVTLVPGWLELTGAATEVRGGGFVGRFYPQDGLNVRGPSDA